MGPGCSSVPFRMGHGNGVGTWWVLLAVAAAGTIHSDEYRDCDGDGEEDECAGDAEGNNVSFGDVMVGEAGHGRRVVE